MLIFEIFSLDYFNSEKIAPFLKNLGICQEFWFSQ